MSQAPDSKPTVLPMIWSGLCMSQLIYAVVGTMQEKPEELPSDVLLVVLFVMSLGVLSFAVVVFPRMYKVDTLSATSTPFIIQWALLETIAVFGLVGRIMGASNIYLYAMVGMAIVFMLVHYPSERRAQAFLRTKLE